MRRSCILYLLLAINIPLISHVNIIDLPRESNTIDLSQQELVQLALNSLFRRGNKIPAITPSEAQHYLSSYVKEKYGEEKGQELINKFFNSSYFGFDISQKTEDPFLLPDIRSMFLEGKPESSDTLQEASKKWSPSSLILTPKDVFNACLKDALCKLRLPTDIGSFDEYKKQFPEKAEEIFSEKYFIPNDTSKQKDYFLHNSFGFFTQSLVQAIYKTAKRIMNVTKQGDYIIIFGNTPYFVGRALQKIASNKPNDSNYRVIIEFPFSGSPNSQRDLATSKDLVTQSRLDHLKKRLKKVGLDPENKQLQNHSVYFIDVIASGGGLAYVIEELLREFKQADIPIPNFNIIILNKINITVGEGFTDNATNEKNSRIAKKSTDDGQHLTLFFPSKYNPHFSVDSQIIYLEGHRLLDDLPSSQWRVFPENNAAYWQPEYDYRFTLPKSKGIQALFEFFDTNINNLIQKDGISKK